jgi:hypothetical protein
MIILNTIDISFDKAHNTAVKRGCDTLVNNNGMRWREDKKKKEREQSEI